MLAECLDIVQFVVEEVFSRVSVIDYTAQCSDREGVESSADHHP